VIEACAAPRPGHPESWISERIAASYRALHRAGHAHSIECWADGKLAGGLYGVGFGRVFCGESMFSRARDASKVALAWLVASMRRCGFTLLDCQFMTPHLASLGAVEIDAQAYSGLLGDALSAGADGAAGASAAFDALDSLPDAPADRALRSATRTVSGPVSGQLIAQLITQTS